MFAHAMLQPSGRQRPAPDLGQLADEARDHLPETRSMSELTMQFTDMTREQFQAHLDLRSVNSHNADGVASFFTEDGVQRRVATGATARGRDAIREAMAESFRIFPDAYVEVRDLFSTSDRMCVQCTLTGTQGGEFLGLQPTHHRVEVDMCLVFRFGHNGLVEEEVIYLDSATMLRQLGLLP